MTSMKRIFFIVLTTVLIGFSLTMPIEVSAQPDPRCDPRETWAECCARFPEASACPIDGGVVALLAAGVGYGIKRARDSRQKGERALEE